MDIPTYKFFERKLPNGKYRYEGYKHTINYCIDSVNKKTEEEINDFLDNCSVDYLVNNEGYVIDIE
jgi:hypothetical protein